MFNVFNKNAAPKKMTSIKFGCGTQYFAKRQSDGYYDLYRRYKQFSYRQGGDVTVVEDLEKGFTQDAAIELIEKKETERLNKAFQKACKSASTDAQKAVLQDRHNQDVEKRRRKTRHHWTKKIVKVGN